LTRDLDGDAGWQRREALPGLRLWTTTDAPLPVHPLGEQAGVVIGDFYDRPPGQGPLRSATGQGFPASDPATAARRLLASGWGQYVALLGSPGRQVVLRDPSGMIDALTWSLGDGLSAVASELWRLPRRLRPRWPSLNWDRIAAFVTVPTAATTPALLDGLVAVGPGELMPMGGERPGNVLWSPLPFAEDLLSEGDARAAKGDLLARVESCTSALLRDHSSLLVELSGGLDSSALAGVVGATGLSPRVVSWLNMVDARPEGDEARYAQAVADRLNVPLTRVPRAPGRIAVEDLRELATEFWPAIAGVDAERDRDEVARLRAADATGLVSGQGGDAVFFQMGAPVVAADAIAARGWRALGELVLPNIARRTRQNVWSVLWEVGAARRGRLPERKIVNGLVSAEVCGWAAGSEHAWTAAALASDLPLGKRLHVRAIAGAQINHQYSRRRQVADLLFPLLAQPVVELALRIPTYVLAGEAHDRPYQRALFADCVPSVVLDRRTKGNASVYFAQLMAHSLDEIRPYLLDGCLCDAGVLDRAILETVMTPEHLIWKDAATDLVTALAAEAWVRYWQTQLPDSPGAGRHR
jgi:asparagine synthase (glutamine-hydrolysing)